MGIAKESVFGIANAYQNDKQDCLVYHLKEGMPLEEGGFLKRLEIRDEEIISVVINPKRWQLKWMLGDL